MISFFKKFFPTKKEKLDHSFLDLQIDLYKSMDEGKQILENIDFKRKIKQEALRLYFEWLKQPIYIINGKECRLGLIVIKPLQYTIYNDNTAIFKGVNIRNLVMLELEQLKNNN